MANGQESEAQKQNKENGSQTTTATTRMINPRVEIDTSQPFGSVKEAVTRFEGFAPWIPHHVLRLAADHDIEEFDLEKVEKQAAELEKDLIVKERETLEVLKNLEAAKRIVEGLKLNLMKEVAAFMESPGSTMLSPDDKSASDLSLSPAPSPGLILMELKQAKLNLNKTTIDLAVIRASVESLNKKMRKEKVLTDKSQERPLPNSAGALSFEQNYYSKSRLKSERSDDPKRLAAPENSVNVSSEIQHLNFEAEQFKYMADAASYEVMKAMSEIEQTKTSINLVEMRLIAAKKMEEAARAVEAIAIAECRSNSKSSLNSLQQQPEGITLSFEEYSALTQKAQQADELSKIRVTNSNNAVHHINEADLSKMTILKKLEETTEEVKHTKKSLEEALSKETNTNRRKFSAHERSYKGRSEDGQNRYSIHNNSANIKFRNSHSTRGNCDSQFLDGSETTNLIKDKTMPVLRSTISIGDILSRKLILQDDMVVGKHVESHTDREQSMSLSQMLREQSGLILCPTKSSKDGNLDRQFFAQRKKFGFIHVSFPMSKQNKKKTQSLNHG